jgi:hypothetical protein
MPGRHRSPKVAAIVGFLVEHFSHAPWRINAKRRNARSRANSER